MLQKSDETASKSAQLYQRACKVMPGGCSRNTILRKPHPLYAERGEGCFLFDIEGVRRIDFANNMASLIHGHANPHVINAVSKQLQRGTAYTIGTEIEIEFAEHMCSRNCSFEKIRFVNSGTEAVMSGIKAARAFTGKAKIAKAEGAYHGLYDYAEVSQTANVSNWGDIDKPVSVPVSHGTPASALDDVLVIPFNDQERAIAILDKHADELACVMIDVLPHRIGLIPATVEFVNALFQWTQKNHVLLMFDEVITFRCNYGGAQQWYDVKPDLTAMGKMIGGGFPVGALAGRADVMDVMNPLADKLLFPHSGTFSANPVTMTAGLAAMRLFDEQAVQALNQLGQYARNNIAQAIVIADKPACVTGAGSMFRIHMKAQAPKNYREVFATAQEAKHHKIVIDHLFGNGLIMIDTCSGMLSTAMAEHEIDVFTEQLLAGLRKL